MDRLACIRREDKNEWERRAPLTPEHVRQLIEENGIMMRVQPSAIRAFSDEAYAESGAGVKEDISPCGVVFAVKEIPIKLIEKDKTYVFFSHTIKGQSYNMPLLRRLLDLNCTLIDYERIVNDEGRRLIFFGRQAGQAGMIDTLHCLGKRLQKQGIETPFSKIKMTHEYHNYGEAREAIARVGEEISEKGLPAEITPFIVGFSGYGNVSLGAQEVFDLLPFEKAEPAKLKRLVKKGGASNVVYKAVFREKDLVRRREKRKRFVLQDYYGHPENYESKFHEYAPNLSVLMNCIYWDTPYPRLLGKEYVRGMFTGKKTPKLLAVGDVSCDIGGSIEFTEKSTEPDNPCFVYDPLSEKITDGVEGRGILVMSVDNLPCELPRDASRYFGEALLPFVPEIVHCDYSKDYENLKLSCTIKNAVITHKGKLAPGYEHLEKYL